MLVEAQPPQSLSRPSELHVRDQAISVYYSQRITRSHSATRNEMDPAPTMPEYSKRVRNCGALFAATPGILHRLSTLPP
jgi:hypothetical protein